MRPVFRIAAGLLGVLFLAMGSLVLIHSIATAGALRGEWRGPLFLISWGVIFVAIAIRGYMTRR